VAISLAGVARRLRELIVALDRRARSVLGERPDRAAVPGAPRMNQTPFPATPADVAVLTVQEFTVDLDEFDGHGIPSMERICRTFMDDANRALVWWIRFGALKAWRTNPDVIARSTSDSGILRDACEVAASFPLNPLWEFDATDFGRALDGMALRRARTGVAR
jgi:hypothetical protein